MISSTLAISQNITPPANLQTFSCGVDEFTEVNENPLPGSYLPICPDPDLIRYVRVNMHFLLPEQVIQIPIANCINFPSILSLGNFTEKSDGTGNTDRNGYTRAEDIIKRANQELDNNDDQWRKNPNETYPASPPEVKVRFLLNGVYFHRDNDAYYRNITSAAIYNLYGVDVNTNINVFYSPIYPHSGQGFGTGPTKYVFNGDYHEYINPCSQDWSIGYSASLLLHEIGHTLTLRHTWVGNDGCNDTPDGATYDALINGNCVARNANCWANDIDLNICPISQGGNGYQPCHHWENISNNMMDYNQWEPHAVTTCQIGRINDDLINGGNMFVHSCNGCMPSQALF